MIESYTRPSSQPSELGFFLSARLGGSNIRLVCLEHCTPLLANDRLLARMIINGGHMNTIIYELLETRILADHGTLAPTAISCPLPAVIIPEQAVIIHTASSSYRVGKGQFIMLLHEGEYLRIAPAEDDEFSPIYSISFKSYRLVRREADSLYYETSKEHLPKHGEVMVFPRHAESQLHHLLDQFRQTASVQTSSKLHLMLHELLDTILARGLFDSKYITKDRSIRQAVDYINQHYHTAPTRTFLAQKTGFNESYFSSLFRKETGWSFAEYLNRIRIDEAKRLLLGTTDKMHEIAYKTGFADGSYLGKTFNRIVNVSPSILRSRRHTTRIAAMQFLGALLAVGIEPIATTQEVLRSSLLLQERLPGIVAMEELNQIDVLRSLAPDLIFAPTYYYNYPDILRELEKIAPVVMLPWGEMDKFEEVREVGRLLGRTYEAEKWIARLQQKGQEAKRKIDRILSPDMTVGLYELWYDDLWMIPHQRVRSSFCLYSLLELTPPSRVKREVLDPSIALRVQEHELAHYAATHMFLIVPFDHTVDYRVKLMQREIWQRLVHEQGCTLHFINLHEFWLDDGVSLEYQLDILVDSLIGNR